MITQFEKYISQFQDRDLKNIVEDINITEEQFEAIVEKIADWYYDNYHITFIGSGAFGTAFRINNEENKVLKVTTDEKEASNISFLVKKSGVKGIVDYYDIHQVNVFDNNEHITTVYSIIMEKLYSISNIESDIFMFLFQKYFKNKDGIINLYNEFSKSEINCSFSEFKQLNPNKVNQFVDKNKHSYYINKYDLDEVKKLANIYYEDIMDMTESVIKYNLILSDVHSDNIRKTEDGHMKIIDPGGYGYSGKSFKTKSAPINIDITVHSNEDEDDE